MEYATLWARAAKARAPIALPDGRSGTLVYVNTGFKRSSTGVREGHAKVKLMSGEYIVVPVEEISFL